MTRGSKIESDTLPVAELGANPAELIERVNTSGRPLVLTDAGESAAVLLGVHEYERLIEEIELLSDIRTSIDQVAEGRAVDNDEAKALLRGRFGA